jgi:hypothetical protein
MECSRKSVYRILGRTTMAVLLDSVAYQSRILVESLGLARLFLCRKVSFRLVTSRFTRAVSSEIGQVGPYKTVADSAHLRRWFRTAIVMASSFPGINC